MITAAARPLPPAPPERPNRAGAYWKPLDFVGLTESLRRAMEDRGWKPSRPKTIGARNGRDAAVSFIVQYEGTLAAPELQPSLGFVASNDRRRNLTFFVGAVVPGTERGDGAFCTTTFGATHKHTIHMDVLSEVEEATDEWAAHAARLPAVAAAARDARVSYKTAGQLLLEASRRKWLAPSRVLRADSDYRRLNVASAWGLLMAYSRAVASGPAFDQMDALAGFYSLLRAEVKLPNG